MKITDLRKLYGIGRAAQKAAGKVEPAREGCAAGDALRGFIDAHTTDAITRDALKEVVDKALAPIEAEPPKDETAAGTALRLVLAGLSVCSLPGDLAGTGIAMATAGFGKSFELPASTMGDLHVGTLHAHAHPPLMPGPPPPVPLYLPSIGLLGVGGCYSVLIGGAPAARAGDLGISFTCGTLAPPFQVYTGSSKVFIGGARAARLGDITKHCQSGGSKKPPPVPPPRPPLDRKLLGLDGIRLGLGAIGVHRAGEEAAASRALAETSAGIASAAGTAEEAAEAAAIARSAEAAAAGHALSQAKRGEQLVADGLAAAASHVMGKDPGVPSCYGGIFSGRLKVFVGGFPVPPLLEYANPLLKLLGKLKARIRGLGLANRLHAWIHGRAPSSARLRTSLHKAACFVTGHPVDVIAGRLLTDAVDFALPGPIPLRFERNYDSAWSGRDSPLGYGWSHSLDQAVWVEPGQLVVLAEDGRELEIALPRGVDPGDDRGPRAIAWFDRLHRVTVRGLGDGRWAVRGCDGLARVFAPVAGDASGRARLVEIADPAGNAIRLEYDARGRLEWVADSGGRRIRFVHDARGRLVQILLPHPDHEGLTGHVEYSVDEAGDLVRVTDSLGYAASFAYDEHRMTRETLRGGLSFHFEYDGRGPEARCVHTWGDGGIYDHRLVYDPARRATVVTNSCGETSVYRAGDRGAVVEVVDPRGGVSRYEYNEWSQRTAEVDPLGHVTRFEYDVRGNCSKIVGPDGVAIEVVHDADDQPIAAVDAVGGRWRWCYDELRRLVACTDPLGQTTVYRHGARLPAAVVDPAGGEVRLFHDAAGNLVRVELPGGSSYARTYDRRGRVREEVDVGGGVIRHAYDLLDRLVRIEGIDGEVQSREYDADGNLIRARAGGRERVMTYTGVRRLASRTEAGTTVGFTYDTEGRLRVVTHEAGAMYRFELDAAGDLAAEYGFDGLRRLYTRDVAGRIIEVHRAGGLRTRFTYDAAGQVVAVRHSDGSGDEFVFRADGELIEARHREPGAAEVVVRIERDLLGRVVREWQGEHWVASDHGPDGLRAGLRSSLGARQRIDRDAAGDVRRVETDGWSAEFLRDAYGIERERSLPGGIRSSWQRDALGRPLEHVLERAPRARLDGSAAPGLPGHVLRRVGLVWDAGTRLRRIEDASRGAALLGHDPRGYLVSETWAGGQAKLRLPDAVGNLFRREDRGDRRYGPAGQLLEAEGVRYTYDAEGNLISKVAPDGASWSYRWSASGTLIAVVRPDGEVVRFAYDALGRRVLKEFRGRKTRWLWDGDVPLHEWSCDAAAADPEPAREPEAPEVERAEALARVAAHPANGPPIEVLTWLFEPESFTPLARLSSREREGASIVTDHLGTPVVMLDAAGEPVWSAELDLFGQVARIDGAPGLCPFRFPGQYEDEETGLHYNRFRYYDPEAGLYIAQDPLGLAAGTCMYGYVRDPSRATDVLGLEEDCVTFYHKADSWRSARAILRGIDLDRGGPNLDFNPRGRRGFYVTNSLRQAKQWKTRSSAIVVFKVPRSELARLKGKVFTRPSREWEKFVRAGRAGRLRHDFDFVEGPLLLNPRQPWRPASARGHQVAIFSDEAAQVFSECDAWIL